MDQVFKALSDPVRRAIIDELSASNDQTLFGLCVRLVSGGFPISRQAISKHVAVLAEAGLVRLSTQGRTTIHHLDTTALVGVVHWIDERVADRKADPSRPPDEVHSHQHNTKENET